MKPNNEQGAALIFVFSVLAVVMALGVGVSYLISSQIASVRWSTRAAQAFYTAEAGVRYGEALLDRFGVTALDEINQTTESPVPFPSSSDQGSFAVEAVIDEGSDILLVSEGKYEGVVRKVKARYTRPIRPELVSFDDPVTTDGAIRLDWARIYADAAAGRIETDPEKTDGFRKPLFIDGDFDIPTHSSVEAPIFVRGRITIWPNADVSANIYAQYIEFKPGGGHGTIGSPDRPVILFAEGRTDEPDTQRVALGAKDTVYGAVVIPNGSLDDVVRKPYKDNSNSYPEVVLSSPITDSSGYLGMADGGFRLVDWEER